MTAVQFALGIGRLAGIVVPACVIAHTLRRRYLDGSGALGVLAEAVLAFSVVLVLAEGLGLIRLMRPFALIPALVLLAVIVWRLPGGKAALMTRAGPAEVAHPRLRGDVTTMSAFVAVVVVSAQWCVQTANAFGAGMANFDTLWYHMPLAAHMAQTGAVTGVLFTQADPLVAYYPANSELFHALGIEAMHSDFLSPLLNLVWLVVALLGAWCMGRPWRIERLTLIAGCLILSLPVLSGTQPGGAFNDIAGLAMLLAGAAIVVNAAGDRMLLAVAGLALGLAVGTKFTFVVPALVLAAGIGVCASKAARVRTFGALGLSLALTAGWWYLRNLIAVGNPEGTRLQLGPLTLPGPTSPLEVATHQSVFSEFSRLSMWGTRFALGLDHGLGPVWPLILALSIAAAVAGITARGNSTVRVLALTAAVTGIAYLFLPSGAGVTEQGTTLFQVNLRFVTPALALGLILVPIVLEMRARTWSSYSGPALVIVLVVAQLEHSLWPTQPVRHLAFLVAAAAVATVAFSYGRATSRPPQRALAVAAAGVLVVVGAGGFVVQRHYFSRRYLTGYKTEPALGAIYRWAQHVAHARIALYGNVQQYPLYGARDSNEVDYIGTRTSDGGFRPITNCHSWRTAIDAGHYRYVVLTPGPTAPIPITWTQADPAAHLIIGLAANAAVLEITGPLSSNRCA